MKVLIPVDGSKYTNMCLTVAASLCQGRDNVEIHVMNVVPHLSDLDFELTPRDRDTMRESFVQHADALVRESKKFLEGKGFKNVKEVIVIGKVAAEEIIKYAEEQKINIIVIGAKGKNEGLRFLLGAESPKVVKYAPCCVYVVKDSCLDFCGV